jgi:phage tail P2-like protein
VASDLLAPNSTRWEHALAAPLVRLSQIPNPLPDMLNALTTPIAVLPWLAWELCVYRWNENWSETRRRQAVANAIADHRRRGTRGAMDDLLAEYDPTLRLVEWWEEGGSGEPYTFTVTLPVNGADAASVTASFGSALLADIALTKPERAHFDVRQQANASISMPIAIAARSMVQLRSFGAMVQPDPADLLKLTTEYGEPLQSDDGAIWEYA